MISLILLVVLCFVILAAYFILKPCLSYQTTESGKKFRFSSAPLSTGFVVSRLLWALVGVVALVYCVSLIIPLVWMFYTSFKDTNQWTISTFALPTSWHPENYKTVLTLLEVPSNNPNKPYKLWDMLFNSIFYAGIAPLVSVFWIALVAYVMSRYRFVGNKFIYNLGILIMMFPIVGNTASEMIFKQKIGLYDNLYLQVFVPPATAFSGMNFMILYGALKAIPQTYSEAARIDGANEYTVMFRIILPMVLPTCAMIYVLSFISLWNAYESFLVWYPSTPNLGYGMWYFQHYAGRGGSGAIRPPVIMAGFVICMIPSMVLYLSSQKLISSKFMVGGLKG